MFSISEHHIRDEHDAIHTALSAIFARNGDTTCEIVNSETGEVLFKHKGGQIQYCTSDFAMRLFVEIATNESEDFVTAFGLAYFKAMGA